MRKLVSSAALLALIIMGVSPVMANDGIKLSADFTGVKFEGDTLMTQASTPWDLMQTSTAVETTYSSSDGSVLHADIIPSGNLAWVLPGECGAAYAPAANRHYPNYPDPLAVNNPWKANMAVVQYPAPDYNPIVGTGYTMEVRLQMLDSVAAYGVYGLGIYAGEGGDATLWDINIFKDKIMTSGGTVFYNGDLSDTMHTIRILRDGGGMAHNPTMELYVDGTKVYTATKDAGGFFYGCAWDQNWLYLGNMAGGARFDANIDYLRMDFTGAYVPEPATMILLASGFLALRRRK
ncbi:MAG: hypothetical protein A2Y12_10435 [Planctomycetes bacterium GWF2_42_9]|nr:MAG: hypothetical protein A2Y12_10435 [Planctomycetes bacterium GWF2_42_9]